MSRKKAKPNNAILTAVIALLFLCCLAVVALSIIGQQANKSATSPTPAVDSWAPRWPSPIRRRRPR